MQSISIPGTITSNFVTDDNRPAISVFGDEGTGKSRFGLTMPTPIGYLALDRKAKRTIERELAKRPDLAGKVFVNDKPFMSKADIQTVSNLGDIGNGKADITEDEISTIKAVYKRVTTAVWSMAQSFAQHPKIQSIVVDRNSEFYEWIMYAHFGRVTKLSPMLQRSVATSYMVDFINLCSSKNLLLIHGTSEIYKDTGRFDKEGNKIQEGSGKFSNDGWKKIGTKVEANIELYTTAVAPSDLVKFKDDQPAIEKLKYHVRVYTCQSNSLLEKQTLDRFGVCGSDITWENLTEVLEINE